MSGWHWRLARQCEVRGNLPDWKLNLDGPLVLRPHLKFGVTDVLRVLTGGQAASATLSSTFDEALGKTENA